MMVIIGYKVGYKVGLHYVCALTNHQPIVSCREGTSRPRDYLHRMVQISSMQQREPAPSYPSGLRIGISAIGRIHYDECFGSSSKDLRQMR
jgi:hypothetical protein